MDIHIIIISVMALLASVLTFFSGFGLGTIMLPVFLMYFPVDVAIAMTGVVHFTNNIFKFLLVGKQADKTILIRFGIPAFLSAIIGAVFLFVIQDLPAWYQYQLGSAVYSVMPVKVIIAALLIIFSLADTLPVLKNIQFGGNHYIIGGMLSGFFGGLTGIQGALRSAFLIKCGLSKESFIATGVVIACLVDVSRLSVYASRIGSIDISGHYIMMIAAVFSAIVGAYAGNRLLKKITFGLIQTMVTILLLLFAVAMGAGFI